MARALTRPWVSVFFLLFSIGLGAFYGASAATLGVHATIVTGPARVVDGDTIDIGGERVRLEGIDTPEVGQTCPRRWIGTWKCGLKATLALRKLVAGRMVRCEGSEFGRYGRLLGTCFVEGRNINAHMVRTGYAWAFVKYSTRYVVEERAARAEKIGIWSGRNAHAAWEFRARRWARAEQVAPQGCAIKGNISGSGGKIYHAPWSPWYDKVIIDLNRGERWFCSERDAKAAGWRAARGL